MAVLSVGSPLRSSEPSIRGSTVKNNQVQVSGGATVFIRGFYPRSSSGHTIRHSLQRKRNLHFTTCQLWRVIFFFCLASFLIINPVRNGRQREIVMSLGRSAVVLWKDAPLGCVCSVKIADKNIQDVTRSLRHGHCGTQHLTPNTFTSQQNNGPGQQHSLSVSMHILWCTYL